MRKLMRPSGPSAGELVERSGQADLLAACANSIETATYGIVSLVLPSDEHDKETHDIRHKLLDQAHRLRQIAIAIHRDKDKRQ